MGYSWWIWHKMTGADRPAPAGGALLPNCKVALPLRRIRALTPGETQYEQPNPKTDATAAVRWPQAHLLRLPRTGRCCSASVDPSLQPGQCLLRGVCLRRRFLLLHARCFQLCCRLVPLQLLACGQGKPTNGFASNGLPVVIALHNSVIAVCQCLAAAGPSINYVIRRCSGRLNQYCPLLLGQASGQ